MNIKKTNEASTVASSLMEDFTPLRSEPPDLPQFQQNPCQRSHPEGYIEFPIGHAVIRVFQHDALSLSYRQRIVLDYAIQGKSDKVIARELNLSPATIKQHLIAIRRHLRASSRSELCFRSILCGLIEIIPLRAEEGNRRFQHLDKKGELNSLPTRYNKPE